MARPQTVSDDEILEAARTIMFTRGVEAFTLSDVAKAVGLSRAAIIQRFNSTHDLKLALLQRMVAGFRAGLEAQSFNFGAQGLVEIAGYIGRNVGSRQGSLSFFAAYNANLKDEAMKSLELERGRVLNEIIAGVMPEGRLAKEDMVNAFLAHLSGTVMNWLSRDDDNPQAFLEERTRNWVRLAGLE